MDAAPHQLLGQRVKNAARRSSLALVAAEHCMSPEAAEALHSKPGQQVHSLYSVLLAGLAPRLVLLGAPRAVRQTVPGALSAPYGSACVCFLYVVGLAELLAWDPQEAASALALFSALIKQQLMAWNGYLEHLKQLPWSDRLLAHPLAESLVTAEKGSSGEARQTLVYRGLRIKVGADVGAVRTSLQPVTGVMAFRGRVMNRAARIASRAGSGQVLCSAAVWAHWAGNSMLASDGLPSRAVLGSTPELGSEGEQLLPRLTAVSQGLVPLKGVPEPVEVMQVM
ncbi:guanylate cyclase domain-containing protein, partial [Haematococcus lacustris]